MNKIINTTFAMGALLFWGCISPSEPSGVKVENMITLETVGYCRDLDLNDSLLVAAADQNGYVVYSIEFASDGSFSYDEMYGTDPEDHEGEEFQGGEVQIASRYNYFLLMDQADALYYVNFTDVDSIGRIPYPGSEIVTMYGVSVLMKPMMRISFFLRSTGPRMELPHSSPLSSIPYVYSDETDKVELYWRPEFDRINGLNQDAENLYLGDSLLVVGNSQLGVSLFRQNSDGSLNDSTFAVYNISGGYEVQTVMTQDGVVFAGLSNDGGCHIAQINSNGGIDFETQIAEGYTVNGIHMKSGILALACGSDGLLLYEWNGFDSSSPAAEVGRLDSDYAYNVKVFDEKNIFAATRAGVQLFQIGD
jgi:hypothetical protein